MGSYPAGQSPFKVLDMAGNVAEWTASDYNPYPNGSAKPDPGNKVMRGGSFRNPPEQQTTTERRWDRPQFTDDWLGFRCAQTPN